MEPHAEDPEHHDYYTINNYYTSPPPNPGVKPAEDNPKKPESESEDDDEEELEPQYSSPAEYSPFLSVQAVRDQYTEIQVGVGFTPWNPVSPPCDNCRSKRKDGKHPIVYGCPDCIRHQIRPLCRKCARKEFQDDSALHEIDHRVRKWQPSWSFNLRGGIQTPMVSSEMEEYNNSDFPDDIRALTFEARDFFDDRAIRCFLPAPGGPCRIVAEVKVKPLHSERLHRSLMDRAKGVFKDDGLSEVAGAIGVSAYPFSLIAPPIAPRLHVATEPHHRSKDKKFASSTSVEIRRNDDFHKPYMLEVYVNTGSPPQSGVELVFQDASYESDEFRDVPFKWVLKSISITHIPPVAPSFASMAQMEQFRRKQEAKRREEWEQRQAEMKERREKQHEEEEERRQKYQEWREQQHEEAEARKQKYEEQMEQRQKESVERLQAQKEERERKNKERKDKQEEERQSRHSRYEDERQSSRNRHEDERQKRNSRYEEQRQGRQDQRQDFLRPTPNIRPTSMPPRASSPHSDHSRASSGHGGHTSPSYHPSTHNTRPYQPNMSSASSIVSGSHHGSDHSSVRPGKDRLAPADAYAGGGSVKPSRSGRSTSPSWRAKPAASSSSRKYGSTSPRIRH